MRVVLLLVPLATLAGCVPDIATGCDFREGSLNGPEDRCQERTGVQASGFDAACEASGGVVVDGGCPMDGVVAGCTTAASGGEITDWYYAPETLESVTEECESGGDLVEP